jgi:hypothetical protein
VVAGARAAHVTVRRYLGGYRDLGCGPLSEKSPSLSSWHAAHKTSRFICCCFRLPTRHDAPRLSAASSASKLLKRSRVPWSLALVQQPRSGGRAAGRDVDELYELSTREACGV